MKRLSLVFLAVLGVASACAAPPPTTSTPSAVVTVIQVVATPPASPTATRTSTTTPVPTAFVTAPAPGTAANVPILMYHHFQDLADNATELDLTWTVSPRNFDAQMNLVAQRGFHTITMGQLVAHLKEGKPLPAKPIVVSFDDGWEQQYVTAFPILRKYGLVGTFFVYTRPINHEPYMTWEQLQEMTTAGMDFEAHTLTHPHLRTLPPDEALKEISDSKTILETRLGKPIVAFAYPFGEYDAAVIQMVKQAGFLSAVTLASGYHQKADELFTLHRIRVSYQDTLDEFSSRLPP